MLIAFLAVLLTACSERDLLQRIATEAEQATAQRYVALLQEGDLEPIERRLDAPLRGPQATAALAAMARLVPSSAPLTVELVGAHRSIGTSPSLTLTYQYDFGSSWLLVIVQTRDDVLLGLHVQPRATSLQDASRARPEAWSWKTYLVVAGTALAPVLVLAALTLCIRSRLRGRKWPWIIFILLGLGGFSADLATGEVGVNFLTVQLLAAGATWSEWAPSILQASIPLGAILFLFRRPKLLASGDARTAPDATPA
ncbi:hypothetical protein [Coralloluteibacterium thermophilus]|uniref:Lipoprotein n=1 Tax=Coralloluteibacterium thermophilum TaxID=2707049 RepID=A0ABV9NQY5_9GAMM